jgi:NADPH:quinone reductase-like Zn-dependent oxidoreductase
VIGQDLAGTVERVGAKVTRFGRADEVFGGDFGAFAGRSPVLSRSVCPTELGFVAPRPAARTGMGHRQMGQKTVDDSVPLRDS